MILLIIALVTLLFLIHQFWYRLRNLPKGPLPLPLIGNVHSLWNEERWENKLLEWKNQYGDIYTFFMGPIPIVGVNDYQTAVDMFVKDGDTYVERAPFEKFIQATRGGSYGIIDTSGSMWRDQRRFTLRVLRDFGLGKNKMQERILEEIQTICENINKDIASGIDEHDFHKHTDLATGSVINAVVCGYRFSTNGKEKEFYKMKKITEEMMRVFSDPLLNMAISSEFLTSFPIIKPRFEKAISLFDEVASYLSGIIDDHIKNNDYTNEIEPQDYIDAFLQEMHRCEERGEPHYFSKIQLRNVVFDLWFAGQETTSGTLTWGIAYLIRNPGAQKKLHEELDRVIGSDRLINLTDKTNLSYLNAVVMEIQRCANIIASNLPRRCTKDVELNGCLVKKGTIVIPQISVIMADPKVFKNPKEFNPGRFIDENGNFKPMDEVVPFSLGKRQCLGEALARMEMTLFFANFFNQYKFTPGNVPPSLKKAVSGASLATEPFKCRVEKRFK